ncbi:MAG: leucine--tRNA ligase [Candidatus Aenigmarchaeota archaeon]|nr:leucine--tRNA ligase [Candidatus Aenigmarchaeota archaeon]NIP40780.1 leucine--tRNA ligase [Candidatus Aenigmarchaeota archaeon]NIQ17370.1 leucine--tRNA ligase [Candidatus Aenigmarchaeota archaeon]NIS73483.1 leucine--tRNA ligase [Candidatus Aenigmarchaeota archaeon]
MKYADLKRIERKWQNKWKDRKAFEPEIDKKRRKFFFTTPYPYISGSLHIGHGRAVTESDIYVRYKRMKGLNVLYPLAFHITGTPILGISSAIKGGEEKKINLYKGYVKNYVRNEKRAESILESFSEPWNIVKFFAPKMMDEYSSLGLSIDWTRRFTTGDPDYQKFITWQFTKYRDKDYLVKGSYPVLYCPNCENAVGEDDIQDADTNPVIKQEFTLLKFRTNDGLILVAGTLRPETVFGQTNLWINPEVEYVKVRTGDETWVMSREAYEKLSYQKKNMKTLEYVSGKEFVGKRVKAPGIGKEIMILPSSFVDPNISSGIVTSVPSDAPYDWVALRELQGDRKLSERYGLDFGEISRIKPVPIINVPGWGDLSALKISEKMKLKGQKDPRLEEATQTIYREGFHKGVMNRNCGRYAGMKVTVAKDRVKEDLLKKSEADVMYETSREAYCRDGTRVVVSILEDQWFLDFNAKGWKTLAYRCLKHMKLLPETMRKLFEDTFEWLDKRPAARKRGLGTPLPFDRKWIIESLSDSTIYMSFYILKKLIEKYKIKPKHLEPSLFDYVYLGKGSPKTLSRKLKIKADALKEMRSDFEYWYPNDHRHTYVAHLSNHLSFFIFAHAGIFPEKFWPRKISFHGFVQSEGMKMSKSKGNVITLLDVKNKYGADTFRSYISTATTLEGTFDWKTKDAENMRKNLVNLYSLLSEIIRRRKRGKLALTGKSFISRFENSLKEAGEALEEMRLRDYGNIVIYQIPRDIKKLGKRANESELKAVYGMIAEKYVKMLNPVVPHLSEEMWEKLGNRGFVSLESWPKYDSRLIDKKFIANEELLDQTIEDIRSVLKLVKIKPKRIRLFVSPKWKYDLFRKLKKTIEKTRDVKEVTKKVMDREHGIEIPKIAASVLRDPSKIPVFILDQSGEFRSLEDSKNFLEKEFGCKIDIIRAEDSESPRAAKAMPGKPGIEVE